MLIVSFFWYFLSQIKYPTNNLLTHTYVPLYITFSVPWGQVVGDLSILDKIYTGYGEGVSQGKVMNRGSEYTKAEFPLLDYITSCKIMAKDLPWIYKHDNTVKKEEIITEK